VNLTKTHLKKIIQEEFDNLLNEQKPKKDPAEAKFYDFPPGSLEDLEKRTPGVAGKGAPDFVPKSPIGGGAYSGHFKEKPPAPDVSKRVAEPTTAMPRRTKPEKWKFPYHDFIRTFKRVGDTGVWGDHEEMVSDSKDQDAIRLFHTIQSLAAGEKHYDWVLDNLKRGVWKGIWYGFPPERRDALYGEDLETVSQEHGGPWQVSRSDVRRFIWLINKWKRFSPAAKAAVKKRVEYLFYPKGRRHYRGRTLHWELKPRRGSFRSRALKRPSR
jgi:hypothetical protein